MGDKTVTNLNAIQVKKATNCRVICLIPNMHIKSGLRHPTLESLWIAMPPCKADLRTFHSVLPTPLELDSIIISWDSVPINLTQLKRVPTSSCNGSSFSPFFVAQDNLKYNVYLDIKSKSDTYMYNNIYQDRDWLNSINETHLIKTISWLIDRHSIMVDRSLNDARLRRDTSIVIPLSATLILIIITRSSLAFAVNAGPPDLHHNIPASLHCG